MKKSTLIRRLSIWPVIVLVLLALGCGGTTNTALNPSNPQGKIVFSSNRGLAKSQFATPSSAGNIWIMNADGTGASPLTTNSYGDSFDPVWSPDGTRIAFSLSSTRSSAIWVMNADGTGAIRLTAYPSDSSFTRNTSHPVWSPDGTKIALRNQYFSKTVFLQCVEDVSIANADGTGLQYLPGCAFISDYRPQWSPDGTKLVYSSSKYSFFSGYSALNIWVWNVDGTGEKGLSTMNHAESINPEWSPDGTRIVFASSRALDGSDSLNSMNIWVMNADGTGAKPLTRYISSLAKSYAPKWSPDGTKIIFSSTRALDGSDAPNINSKENIWIMNADGTGITPLTRLTQQDNKNPVWSPDGTKIAFDSPRMPDGSDAAMTEGHNIWVMNSDGTGAKCLTQTTPPSYNRDPQWHR